MHVWEKGHNGFPKERASKFLHFQFKVFKMPSLFYDCISMELVQDFKQSLTRKLFKSMEIRKTM
jgi:hypothetical protein